MEENTVKKQTLIGAIVISLILGFLGGVYYTSHKLGSRQTAPVADTGHAGPAPHPDPSAPPAQMLQEIASQTAVIEKYLKENPEDAKAWASLGNLYFEVDQHQDAIKAYEKSLALEPAQPGVMTDMGTLYRKAGQPKKAIEIYNRVIAQNPSFETAYYNKWVVLFHDLHDREGGIKALEDLLKVSPDARVSENESVKEFLERIKAMQTQ